MNNKIATDQESNKSELSTSLEIPVDSTYFDCITSLTLQNKYIKNALKTAEDLILNYQKDNQALAQENMELKERLHYVERSVTFGNYISPCNTQSILDDRKISGEDQATQTVDTLEETRKEERMTYDLAKKVQLLMECQQKYEDKIRGLENHILILERQVQEPKKIAKHHLNIGLAETMFSSTNLSVSEIKKPKNLSELRALHLKMMPKDERSELSKSQTNKTIVSRVFSTERLLSQTSNLTPSKKKKNPNINFGTLHRSKNRK